MTRAEKAAKPWRTGNWITKVRRLAIYLRDGFRCQYCGRDLRSAEPSQVTLEHLECWVDNPTGKLSNGLSVHHESNLITCCLSCNSGRGDRTKWYRYATQGAKERIQRVRRRKLNTALAKAIIAGEQNLNELQLERIA